MSKPELSLAAVFFCAFVATSAGGQTTPADDNALWNAACAQVGEVALSIIRLRQDDVPMSTMMKRLDETVGAKQDEHSKRYAEFLRGLVMKAYAGPVYRTEELRKATIAEFRNEAELACYAGGI